MARDNAMSLENGMCVAFLVDEVSDWIAESYHIILQSMICCHITSYHMAFVVVMRAVWMSKDIGSSSCKICLQHC